MGQYHRLHRRQTVCLGNLGRLKTAKKEYHEAVEKVNLLKQRLKDHEIQEAALKEMTEDEKKKVAEEAVRKSEEDLKRKSLKQDITPEKVADQEAGGEKEEEDAAEKTVEIGRSPVKSRAEVLKGSQVVGGDNNQRTSKRIKSQGKNQTLGVLESMETSEIDKKLK